MIVNFKKACDESRLGGEAFQKKASERQEGWRKGPLGRPATSIHIIVDDLERLSEIDGG